MASSAEEESGSSKKTEAPEEGSWWSSWGKSIIDTVKEKAYTTAEMVEKDLNEFYQTIQLDTATAVVDTAGKVQEKIKVDKDDKDTPQASFKQGISSILSTVSESLKTFTQEEETEPDRKVEASLSSPIYDRREMKIQAIQSDVSTYCNEPEGLKETFISWKESFDFDSMRSEMSDLLVKNPEIRAIYSRLVPAVVPHSTFWLRYFYKIHQYKEEEERRAALVARADSTSLHEEELRWDSDDGEDDQPIPTIAAITEKSSSNEMTNEKQTENQALDKKGEGTQHTDDTNDNDMENNDKEIGAVDNAEDKTGDNSEIGDQIGETGDIENKKEDNADEDSKCDDNDDKRDEMSDRLFDKDEGAKSAFKNEGDNSTVELASFDENPEFSASTDCLDSPGKEAKTDPKSTGEDSLSSSFTKQASNSSGSSVEVINASELDISSQPDITSADVAAPYSRQTLGSSKAIVGQKSISKLSTANVNDQSETSSTGSWISVDDEIRVRKSKKDKIADPNVAGQELVDSKRNSDSSNSSAVIVEKSECKQSDDEDNDVDDFDLDEELNDEEMQKIMQKISDKPGDIDDDDDWESWE